LTADNSPEFSLTGRGSRAFHNKEYGGLNHDELDALVYIAYQASEGPLSAFEIGMNLKSPNVLETLRSLARKGYVSEVR